jgi:hypothetical protein
MRRGVAMGAWVLAAVMLGTGCGSGTASDEQRVTDTVDAYHSALLAGDGNTACGYMTPAMRQRIAGHDKNGAPVSCARETFYLHQDPGFVRINKDLAVTRVSVHGDKAEVQAQSPSKQVVTANYQLVKRGGDWRIDSILGTS